jgi:exodeoxyribonuclease V alpha subunit
MLQRNLLYTAITRARRFCVVVGPLRALQRAVQTDAPIARHTRLARLLGAPMLADRSDMLHD